MLNLKKRLLNLWRLSELELPKEEIKGHESIIQLMKPKQMAKIIKHYKKDPLDEFIENDN